MKGKQIKKKISVKQLQNSVHVYLARRMEECSILCQKLTPVKMFPEGMTHARIWRQNLCR